MAELAHNHAAGDRKDGGGELYAPEERICIRQQLAARRHPKTVLIERASSSDTGC